MEQGIALRVLSDFLDEEPDEHEISPSLASALIE